MKGKVIGFGETEKNLPRAQRFDTQPLSGFSSLGISLFRSSLEKRKKKTDNLKNGKKKRRSRNLGRGGESPDSDGAPLNLQQQIRRSCRHTVIRSNSWEEKKDILLTNNGPKKATKVYVDFWPLEQTPTRRKARRTEGR